MTSLMMKKLTDKRKFWSYCDLQTFLGDKEKVTRQSKAGHIIGGDAVSSARKSGAVH